MIFRQAVRALAFCALAFSPVTAAAQSAAGEDFKVWAAISESRNPSDFRAFLRQYPNSPLAAIAAARLEPQQIGSGSRDAGRLFRYANSARPLDAGGRPIAKNRMHVRLDAPQGETPASVPIDDERLMAFCADEDGCLVSVAIVGWVFEDGSVPGAPLTSSACRLFIRVLDGKRHWSVDVSCYKWFALWSSGPNSSRVWRRDQDPGFFTPYFSLQWGIDGQDQLGSRSAGTDRGHVFNFATMCSLAETPPDVTSKAGGLMPDVTPGFHFIAATGTWTGDPGLFERSWPSRNRGRACELLIED